MTQRLKVVGGSNHLMTRVLARQTLLLMTQGHEEQKQYAARHAQ